MRRRGGRSGASRALNVRGLWRGRNGGQRRESSAEGLVIRKTACALQANAGAARDGKGGEGLLRAALVNNSLSGVTHTNLSPPPYRVS